MIIKFKRNDIFLLIKKKNSIYFIFSVNFNFKSGKIYIL